MIVFNLKEMTRKLFFIVAISLIVFFCVYFFKSQSTISTISSTNVFDKFETTDNSFFVSIIDKTIPGISIMNNSHSEENSYVKSSILLQTLLAYELPLFESAVYIEEAETSDDGVAKSESPATNNTATVEHAETGVLTQVLDSIVPNTFTDDYNGVEIKNGTNYDITDDIYDVSSLDINKSDVIIFHTHTCESYNPTENYTYEESGTFRTIDLNFSVARVGDSLSEQLLSYGFNVSHDKTYHDYPDYSGSYGRSQATVENILLSHPSTDIIIDLHRDAIADTTYAPSVKIGDEVVSQLMFVIGTDGGGLEHSNWRQNLKFAIAVQQKANELYPGLFRPILLRNSRYNQHLGKAACIIEVGATGNTLEQSMASMKYLALVLNEILH